MRESALNAAKQFIIPTSSHRQVGLYHNYYCYSAENDTDISAFTTNTSCIAAGFDWTDKNSFDAPWTQTLLMFIGSLSTIIICISHCHGQARR